MTTLPAAPAHAESLRCQGHSAAEGDSRLSVLYKCGEPLLKDSFCAPWVLPGHGRALHPMPGGITGFGLPCQPVEEWLYDRGAGHLVAVVRFQGGVVQSIRYGRVPR